MIEGTVTSVNLKLWSFLINNDVTVTLPHLALAKNLEGLPQIGAHVKLNGHYHPSERYPKEVLLCGQSVLQCKHFMRTGAAHDYDLLRVINKYRLGVGDLQCINSNLRTIKESCFGLSKLSAEQVLISAIDKLGRRYGVCNDESAAFGVEHSTTNNIFEDEHRNDTCLKTSLGKYTLHAVSDCRHVNNTNERYLKFPYWSFGVHAKVEKTTVLIGYFYISDNYGIPMIKDIRHTVPCCVLTSSNRDLLKLRNRLVLIVDYRIFTEIYNQDCICPLEYMVCKIEDVYVLDAPSEVSVVPSDILIGRAVRVRFYERKPATLIFKHNFKFKLVNKSTVMCTSEKAPECWLMIQTFENGESNSVLLALTPAHLHIAAFLVIGTAYELFHNDELAPHHSIEMQRAQTQCCHLYVLADFSAIFTDADTTKRENESLPETDLSENIMSVEEVEKYIKAYSDMLSFEGIVYAKEFVRAIESRTGRVTSVKGFGTLGVKTHVLQFMTPNDVRLSLYLNNWECSLTPLGLLPGMKVLVRNVVPQKRHYLKCTPLTTFTVLAYEPRVEFETMNIKDELYGCGKICSLASPSIPSGVLLIANISKINIRSLRIIHENVNQHVRSSAKSDFSVNFTFYASDHAGEAVIVAKSLTVLRTILGLTRCNWANFLEAVCLLGTFDFRHCSFVQKDRQEVHRAVQATIKVATSNALKTTELCCRKMEPKPNDKHAYWFCCDIKSGRKY